MSRNDPQINRDTEPTGREPALDHRPGSLDAFHGATGALPQVPGKARPTLVWGGDDPDLIHWARLSEECGYETRISSYRDLHRMIRAITPDLVLCNLAHHPHSLAGKLSEIRSHPDVQVARGRIVVFARTIESASMNALFANGIDDILMVSDWNQLLHAVSRVIRYGTAPAPLTALTNPSTSVRHAAMHHSNRLLTSSNACAGLRRLAHYPDSAVQATIRAVQIQLGCEV